MRASDADRERTAALLQRALADGRLTVDEFGERSATAYAATTRDELAVLTRDLLVAPAGVPAPAVGPAAETAPPVVAVFSGARRVGRWRPARRERAVAVFGGVDLDLREAELPAGGLHVSAWAVFGGVHLLVPDGVRVELSGFSLFGGREVHEGADLPGSDAYVVHVHAVAVFGGVHVRSRGRGRWS
jgi:hypothetical protein